MNRGNFKQLVRTLRNWKNEGIQIKRDITPVPKRAQGEKGHIRRETNNNFREE